MPPASEHAARLHDWDQPAVAPAPPHTFLFCLAPGCRSFLLALHSFRLRLPQAASLGFVCYFAQNLTKHCKTLTPSVLPHYVACILSHFLPPAAIWL